MAEPNIAESAEKKALERVGRDFEEADRKHPDRVQKVEDRYKAYRGYLEQNSEAAQWTSKIHPPYILQIVETIVANLIDDRLRFQVNPAPRMAAPDDLVRMKQGSKTMELLLRHQMRLDKFDEKQRPFILQACVAGWSVAKTSWLMSEGMRSRLEMEERFVQDKDTGELLTAPSFAGVGLPPMQRPVAVPVLTEKTEKVVYRDDPTVEVRDVRDFFFPESAKDIDTSPFVIDRTWVTMEDLEERKSIYRNLDKVRDRWSEEQTSAERADREQTVHGIDRTRGLVEVWEHWDRRSREVTTVAARDVVIAGPKPWPFWHGGYPFVLMCTTPDLYLIEGISLVERIAQLQTLLWTLMNQRIDNLTLINNAMILRNTELLENPDDIVYEPGGVIDVNGPIAESLQLWSPTPLPAEISIGAEEIARGDMQNITGGGPFLSGAESGTIDQTTATGVSIVTSLAQKVLASAKQQVVNAYKRIGDQWIALDQQFVREERLIRVVGKDASVDFRTVDPMEIQGQFEFELEPSTESLMRQERRAEKMAMFTTAAQVAPIMAGVGTPFNLQAFAEEWLEAEGVEDKERFFSAQPQMQMGAPGLPGGAPGASSAPPGGAPEGEPLGVTAPQATDASSPSSQVSRSPIAMLQRALAMRGQGRQ